MPGTILSSAKPSPGYVKRLLVEKSIVTELKGKLLTVKNLEYVYKNVEKLVAKGLNDVLELTKKKKALLDKLLSEIQNYLNYIKSGNFSKAVSDALKEAENRSDNLKEEVKSLEFQQENTFKAPPKEWIGHRLEKLRETLNKNTVSSAKALKELLGPIKLEPIMEKNKDFYGIMEMGLDSRFYPSGTSRRNDSGVRRQEAAPTEDKEGRDKSRP